MSKVSIFNDLSPEAATITLEKLMAFVTLSDHALFPTARIHEDEEMCLEDYVFKLADTIRESYDVERIRFDDYIDKKASFIYAAFDALFNSRESTAKMPEGTEIPYGFLAKAEVHMPRAACTLTADWPHPIFVQPVSKAKVVISNIDYLKALSRITLKSAESATGHEFTDTPKVINPDDIEIVQQFLANQVIISTPKKKGGKYNPGYMLKMFPSGSKNVLDIQEAFDTPFSGTMLSVMQQFFDSIDAIHEKAYRAVDAYQKEEGIEGVDPILTEVRDAVLYSSLGLFFMGLAQHVHPEVKFPKPNIPQVLSDMGEKVKMRKLKESPKSVGDVVKPIKKAEVVKAEVPTLPGIKVVANSPEELQVTTEPTPEPEAVEALSPAEVNTLSDEEQELLIEMGIYESKKEMVDLPVEDLELARQYIIEASKQVEAKEPEEEELDLIPETSVQKDVPEPEPQKEKVMEVVPQAKKEPTPAEKLAALMANM